MYTIFWIKFILISKIWHNIFKLKYILIVSVRPYDPCYNHPIYDCDPIPIMGRILILTFRLDWKCCYTVLRSNFSVQVVSLESQFPKT